MLTFTQRLSLLSDLSVGRQPIELLFILSLTAKERTQSRYCFETPNGQALLLRLPRGTVLRDGDLLLSETGESVKIAAKPEPVFTVTAKHPLDLLRAAYHLGNRHIAIEITPTYLRLSPDPLLKEILEHLGVEITEEVLPFHPEIDVYGYNYWEGKDEIGVEG